MESKCRCSFYITAPATFAFHIRVLELGRMPSVTLFVELIVDQRERGETMTSKVPFKVKPASRAVCVMMTWDGIPPPLKTDETFVLLCAPFNLDVERAVTLPFRECENKSRESRRTPQTETADPCRGCISHLNVSLWCTMKVQHYINRGTHCKCRPRVQWLHQCEVVSLRS